MNRFFPVLLVGLLALTLLGGCGGQEASSAPSSSSSSAPLEESSSLPAEAPSSQEPLPREEASSQEDPSSQGQTQPDAQPSPSQESAGASQSLPAQGLTGQLVENNGQVFDMGEFHLGSQEELDQWAAASLSQTASLLVSTFDAERPLTQEEAQAVLDTIRNLDPQLLSETGNPPSGGSTNLIAYDAAQQELWRVTVNESWVILRLPGWDSPALFGIQGQDLEALQNL